MAFATETCYTNWMQQDVFDKLPHLQKRHNRYGIRVRVPDELRAIIGKREITRSPGTGDPIDAKPIYHKKLVEVHEELEAARRSITPSEPPLLTPEKAEQLAMSYWRREFYERATFAYQVYNSDNAITLDNGKIIIQEDFNRDVRADLRDMRAESETYATGCADRLLLENGFPKIIVQPHPDQPQRRRRYVTKRVHVDRASPGYKTLLRLCFQGEIESCKRTLAILDGKEPDNIKSIFSNFQFSIPNTQISTINEATIKSSNGFKPISLDELFQRFIEAHPKKLKRWKLDLKTAFKCLTGLKGKLVDANLLTKKDFRELLAFIRRMPTQIGNNKRKWKGMSLQDIVAATEQENGFEENLLHPTTVNKYMRNVNQVMNWAEQEPLIVRNHATGILIPADEFDDDDPSRTSFSMDHV